MRHLTFLRALCLLCLYSFSGQTASDNTQEKETEAPAASQLEKKPVDENQDAEKKTEEKKKDTKGNFARGIKIWGRTCAGCHNMRDPKDFDDKGWEMIVMHMRVRAGLTGQDTRDVLEFLKRSN